MSARAGQWSDDEIEDMLDGEHGGEPTDLVKNLRAALRAKAKEASNYRAELDGVKTISRKSTIENLLKARELDAKIATFIPADVEATEESVGKWLDEYGDVFGAKPPAQQQQLSDADIAAMRQMDAFAGATSPAATNDLMRNLQNAASTDDVLAMIRAAGGEV
jgi:hypothetical protein